MPARPVNHTRWKERLSESFWFIPFVCLVFATGLALTLMQIDDAISGDHRAWGFTGGPESARQVLATIASSMLTLTGLVFSITIVAFQLTSTQFSPRALRTFLRDRRTQLSLGIFVATFFYALVALREVRGQDNSGGGQFVPGVTITAAFVLVVVGVGTFVFYIHHISQSIRVITIIRRIGEETTRAIGCLPDEAADPPVPATPTAGPVKTIASSHSGVFAGIEVGDLVDAATGAGAVVEIVPGMGDFVPRGGPLLRVCGEGNLDEARLRSAILLEEERTMHQDIGYGLRQLVDIAEKALSPGINDPSTAVQCLDQIHDVLRQLVFRSLPTGRYPDRDGWLRLVVPMPSWSDYVHLGIDEIRHWGAGSLQVHRRLHVLLDDLLSVAEAERREALLHQRRLLRDRCSELPPSERLFVSP